LDYWHKKPDIGEANVLLTERRGGKINRKKQTSRGWANVSSPEQGMKVQARTGKKKGSQMERDREKGGRNLENKRGPKDHGLEERRSLFQCRTNREFRTNRRKRRKTPPERTHSSQRKYLNAVPGTCGTLGKFDSGRKVESLFSKQGRAQASTKRGSMDGIRIR